MLQFTPRKITAFILLCFSALFGLKTFAYILQQYSHDQAGLHLEQLIDTSIPALQWLERTDYDAHLRFYNPGSIAKDKISIVEISERSIQKLGQFPFSRDIYARLISRMEEAGAKSVAFDIVFSESERNAGLQELVKLREQAKSQNNSISPMIEESIQRIDNDSAFAAALENAKVPVVMAFSFAGDQARKNNASQISKSAADAMTAFVLPSSQINQGAFSYDKSMDIPVIPHEALMRAVRAPSTVGFFTASPDSDSVIRKTPVVMNFEGGYYGSLSVLAVAQYHGLNPRERKSSPMIVGENGYWIRDEQGKLNIPVNAAGSLLIGYYGGERLFDYVEFADLLEDEGLKLKDKIKDRIIFIGVTAAGLKDIRATPFSPDYPGVEVHATLASNMLTNNYIVKDWRFYAVGMFLVLFGGALMAWASFRLHPAFAFLATLFGITVLQFGAQNFGFDQGVVVPTMVPSIQFIVLLFAGVLYRYFSQEKEKKFVRNALGRYVSGPVVEEILKDQSKLRLGGQKKVMTVMFCDMVGFTKLSESMDAAALTQLLNQFFTRMTAVILKNHGTLDKYMGDAIMCFWGAPLDEPKHAQLACQTALEMIQQLELVNQEWQEKYGFHIGIRLGINTGEMSVGNMGSDQVFSYTVLGDNVNLGSRLEGVNTVYGTTLLVSQSTYELAKDTFSFRHLDLVQVKGKEDAVNIYELLGFREQTQPEWLRFFELGLEHYRKAQWAEAEAAFKACQAQKPADIPTKIFLQRVEELKAWPPEAWDGVWKLSAK
jgi:adenylate cyclase